jgi:predicted ATPase
MSPDGGSGLKGSWRLFATRREATQNHRRTRGDSDLKYNVATYVEEIGAGPWFGERNLHEQSHGQSFFALMENRLRGDGFYIFDEPEAALSPQRQMSALTLIDNLVRENSQLVIATHSPILMAYPDAVIYELSDDGIHEQKYEETQHFQVTRDFLNRHEKMLGILLDRFPLR